MLDESYNYVEKKSQMDLLVSYLDNVINCVVNRYYTSDFLGKTTVLDLFETFKTCFGNLDKNKLIQVFSDVPKVKKKFLSILY